MRSGSRRKAALAALAALALAGSVGTAQALHDGADTNNHTTLEQILAGANPDDGYATLSVEQVDASHLVRDGAEEGIASIPDAQEGRDQRRTSLLYTSQLTDYQLADEESPARVEFADHGASSAWRPQEAFHPFVIDYTHRQLNNFTDASPVPQGDGTGNAMDFALATGDQADNQHRNEMIWVRELIEGGQPLNFNSGSANPAAYDPTLPGCIEYQQPGKLAQGQAEAPKYTGVQDFDDYDEGANPYYYDPDQPTGTWVADGWPTYTGLMDRAQQLSFTPAGINVPTYVTNGNHDVLAQGNEDANREFERIAMGCEKVLATTQEVPPSPSGDPAPSLLQQGSASMLVPPDPLRRFVSKPQIRRIYADGEPNDDDHGYAYVDPAQLNASRQSASYYAWDPAQTPGIRMISIDTNSEGGVVDQSSSGNIDDPQFQWLKNELDAAKARNMVVVIFGHHPVRSMVSNVDDEAAAPCTVNDSHGDTPEHDINPGCDLDPRISTPIHLGRDPQPDDPRESFVELLDKYPNVVMYVAGHTHDNNIEAFPRSGGAGPWWSIETSATADWPQQHRLIELMDNRDGTLSIFGTVLDFAAPAAPPAAGNASGFSASQLASIGRTFAYNDPQAGDGTGEGAAQDQNVELLVKDPRPSTDLAITKADSPDPVNTGEELTYTLEARNTGGQDSKETVVTDNLPNNVDFISATSTVGTCSETNGRATCELGTLSQGGGAATVTIKVEPQQAGQITNAASIRGNVRDTDSTNDSDEETTQVTTSANLSIAKSDSPDPVRVNQQLTYTLNVSNGGPSTADNVQMTDQLPPGVTLNSASASQGSCSEAGGTVTCDFGDIAEGAAATVTIKVSPSTAGTLDNTASVDSVTSDPQAGNDSDTESTTVTQAPLCDGRRATQVGTDGDDVMRGTSGPDVIVSLLGDDTVRAGGGADIICARGHHDQVYGQNGNDRLFAGWGVDAVFGGTGDDLLYGHTGPDQLNGGGGTDLCRGGRGNDVANARNCETIRDARRG